MTLLSLPILVADQDASSRNRLAEVLRDEGYDPVVVGTGGEAVEVIRNRIVPITILDVVLPDFSGIEAFRLITSVRSNVSGIFLAAERSKDMLVRLLEAGAFTVLQKPPRKDVLMEAVRGLESRIERDQEPF